MPGRCVTWLLSSPLTPFYCYCVFPSEPDVDIPPAHPCSWDNDPVSVEVIYLPYSMRVSMPEVQAPLNEATGRVMEDGRGWPARA